MQLNQCKICNQDIPKRVFDSKKKYHTRIVCSRSCYREYCNTPELKKFYKQNRLNSTGNLGKLRTEEWKMEHSKRLTGRKFSDEARKNIAEGHKGEKAYQWKGGISSNYSLIRSSSKYKTWRMEVLKRDWFSCQTCGHKSTNLQVDHIKPFSVIINEIAEIFGKDNLIKFAEQSSQLWDISNGRTLCIDCHEKTPVYMNKKSKYTNTLSALLFTVN